MIIGIDFETYYDKDYSLAKKDTSTTEYVRDSRFKVQSMAIRTEDEGSARVFTGDAIKKELKRYNWKKSSLLAHHAHFDGLILSHHYGIVPSYYYCTLSMARPLHGGEIDNDLSSVAKYYGGKGKTSDILSRVKGLRDIPPDLLAELLRYNGDDVNEMWHIFRAMLKSFPQDELDLIDITVRAYADPILKINAALAKRIHKQEMKDREDLLKRLGIEDKKELTSRDKFAERLRSLGVEPPKKISPANNLPTYAFAKNDIAFQELQNHEDERVRDLVEARLICQANFTATRAARLLSHGKAPNRLTLYLAYGKAHTLRWAGGDKMNPQNFKRTGDLRHVLVAPPGHTLVIGDSAQIEARKNAWLAGETDLVEAFRTGADIYRAFAAEELYKIPPEEIDKTQRFVGKTCILGLGYYMGKNRFKLTLESGAMGPKVKLEEPMYGLAVQAYRKKFPAIVEQWHFMGRMLMTMWKGGEVEYGPITFVKGGVKLPNGLMLKYPNLRPKWDENRQEYYDWRYNENTPIHGGVLTENIVQCLARIVVGEQALKVAKKFRVPLLVHDEIVLCVPTKKAKDAHDMLEEALHTPPNWCKDLPVAGELAISRHYLKP